MVSCCLHAFCALCVADLIVGMEELELQYRRRGGSNLRKIKIATIFVRMVMSDVKCWAFDQGWIFHEWSFLGQKGPLKSADFLADVSCLIIQGMGLKLGCACDAWLPFWLSLPPVSPSCAFTLFILPTLQYTNDHRLPGCQACQSENGPAYVFDPSLPPPAVLVLSHFLRERALHAWTATDTLCSAARGMIIQGKWPKKSTKNSTAKTRHQNPRLIWGKGRPWQFYRRPLLVFVCRDRATLVV